MIVLDHRLEKKIIAKSLESGLLLKDTLGYAKKFKVLQEVHISKFRIDDDFNRKKPIPPRYILLQTLLQFRYNSNGTLNE